MLLLSPPLCKPCEPPAALAYLQGALRQHNLACTVCDLNIELIQNLIHKNKNSVPDDTWSRRASKNLERHLQGLRHKEIYQTNDRYRRAVADINRLLERAGHEHGLLLSLANYQDPNLSPLKSEDLKHSAANFEHNIFFPFFAPRLDQLLSMQEGPVGISLNYLSQALTSFAMIGYLKKHYPERPVILGGSLITTWLSNPDWINPFAGFVDHLIGGRGELPLLHLLGKTVEDQPNMPDYNSLSGQDYLSAGFVLPYATSFGCFWKKCSFCPEKSENNPYEQVPAPQSLTDLARLTQTTRPSLIHFLDNAISPATLKELANQPPGVPWYGFARMDTLLADADFCKKLRASGCIMLKLGLESGDQGVLDGMNKGIDLQLARTVLTNLHKAGIGTYIYLLFGTPQETEIEARATMEFVEEMAETISFLNLAIFNLPRNSPEAADLPLTEFYEGDLSIYSDFRHPRGWDRPQVRRFLDAEFKRSPRIAAILRRDPPFFTSNHAPFLLQHGKSAKQEKQQD